MQPRFLGGGVDYTLGMQSGQKGSLLLGQRGWIEKGVVLNAFGGTIKLGNSVFLGPYTVVYGHGNVTIGASTLISMHCRILSSEHTVPPLSEEIRSKPDIQMPTTIGKDVWLGAGVTVTGGVTIGDGCVVGAGAVVTNDLAPGSVAVGVPAKTIKMRPQQ